MLSVAVVVAAALLWLGLLFGTALYAERHPGAFAKHWRHIYALSLAVHCTSWTFYGTVTQAARYGWPLPPTFIGAILFYALAVFFMIRLVRLARESNATSLADLIATRLGKDAWLAATVTLVTVLGLIPYIALQLQAITMSFSTLTAGPDVAAGGAPPIWRDGALYVALAMALFAILFGTRRASAAEHNRGLVLAIAFESMFKLLAMLALGGFVWFGLQELPEAATRTLPAQSSGGFVPLVILGALAMFLMPHQFHVGVVECRDENDVRTARWQFPLYLLLIALPALPLARAGMAVFGDRVPSDMYALALPLAQGNQAIALLVFLGGLSAATGMVIVGTLALSLMIGNHWFAPGLLRGAWARRIGDDDRGDHRGDLLLLRRVGIIAIMLLGWAYSRLVSGNEALADVGAVSFSALATLAPALAFAIWRPQTPASAATFGVLAGFAAWSWVMLVPMIAAIAGADPGWLREGPFGMHWLAPEALFGLTGWSRLGRAVGVSLFVGTAATLLLATMRSAPHRREARGSDLHTLRNAGRRFLPPQRVDELLNNAPANGPVPAVIESRLEHELAAILGSASARLLLDAARRDAVDVDRRGVDLDTIAAIVVEASQDLRFNQRVLEAALENMSQGISVVDAELRLVAWNRRYAELFAYPPGMLQVGMPIAKASEWALRALGSIDDDDVALQRRLAHMRAGTAHLSERVFPGGGIAEDIIVEIRGNPMPGGGFVATFTDVTAFRQAETGLKRINETLEQRVGERTSMLEAAKREAERANDAKSRFLAAIGHDLLQPLHAAHLFADALHQRGDSEQRELARQIGGALDSTTDLLGTLLDMSRLEAGGLVPEPRDFPLSDVLDPLVAQFGVLARERGLRLRHVPTRAWVRSDPQLLRRVLQNFLANAVRYTGQGSVLLGVRRVGDVLRIEVHDTGPGIELGRFEAIFEEFRRGEDAPGQGLGLGLAIAQRIAVLLGSDVGLTSMPARGSRFSIDVPRVAALQPHRNAKRGLAGLRVLLVDNEPQALEALTSVMRGWGCEVRAVADGNAARAALSREPADLWVFDYHLDHGDDGVAVHERLSAIFPGVPCLILSADQTGAVRSAAQEAGLPLLMKPLRPLALKSVLDRMLAARGVG